MRTSERHSYNFLKTTFSTRPDTYLSTGSGRLGRIVQLQQADPFVESRRAAAGLQITYLASRGIV